MKNLIYFLTIIFLVTTHLSWAQTTCSDVSLQDFVELSFDLNYETGEYSWNGTAKENPPIPYSSYNYNFTVSIDDEAIGGNGGSGNNPDGSTTFSPFENSVDVGIQCVDGELSCESCDATPMQIIVDFTFTLGECTFTGQLGTGINPNECSGGG